MRIINLLTVYLVCKHFPIDHPVRHVKNVFRQLPRRLLIGEENCLSCHTKAHQNHQHDDDKVHHVYHLNVMTEKGEKETEKGQELEELICPYSYFYVLQKKKRYVTFRNRIFKNKCWKAILIYTSKKYFPSSEVVLLCHWFYPVLLLRTIQMLWIGLKIQSTIWSHQLPQQEYIGSLESAAWSGQRSRDDVLFIGTKWQLYISKRTDMDNFIHW